MEGIQRDMQSERQRHRWQHGDEPRDHAVMALAAVEGLLEPRRPRAERALHRGAVAERPPLLDDERGDDRDNAHGRILGGEPAVKLTWPECALSCVVRRVKSTARPSACAMIGTSTAAGMAVASSRPAPSSP